jgi:hypothetical protein
VINASKPIRAFLVAGLLMTAAPAAINAADGSAAGVSPAATPLNHNLLVNGDFEIPMVNDQIPGWTKSGKIRTETFGTRSWPDQAYGTKWGGGLRYLACRADSGTVRQSVDVDPGATGLKARFDADFGGTVGHRIRIAMHVTGTGISRDVEQTKVMDITNHYKRIVATLTLPPGANKIEVTLQLLRKAGAPKCKMVADTLGLEIFQP